MLRCYYAVNDNGNSVLMTDQRFRSWVGYFRSDPEITVQCVALNNIHDGEKTYHGIHYFYVDKGYPISIGYEFEEYADDNY